MKILGTTRRWSLLLAAVCSISLVSAGAVGPPSDPADPHAAANRYIGAGKCKNCHKSDATGNQFGAWESMKHARAFEVLASPEAKELAAKLDIADPQTSDQCLKCHVTAFGVAEDELAKGFDPALGVQCESCHGPGEQHMKARFAAAAKAKPGEPVAIGEGEIITSPDRQTCLGCHNKEFPGFQSFCFQNKRAKILHLNPAKGRSEEAVAALKAPCPHGEDCGCVHDEAGGGCASDG